jgi:hypothetical protein
VSASTLLQRPARRHRTDAGLQSASIGLWVSAGGRHERAEQNGIAHFLEHMAFKGTARRSALQIAEEIEDVGGYINAYTSREVTAYYARVLKEDVPLAIDLIADIVLNPAFDPAEIEVERGVILQEIGQAADTPDDIIFDWLQEEAFPNSPWAARSSGPPSGCAVLHARRFRPLRGRALRAGAADPVGSGRASITADRAAWRNGLRPPARPARIERPEPGALRGGERRGSRTSSRPISPSGSRRRGTGRTTSIRRRSTPPRSAAACPRAFSRKSAKNGAFATRSTRRSAAFDDTGLLTIYAGTWGRADLPDLSG